MKGGPAKHSLRVKILGIIFLLNCLPASLNTVKGWFSLFEKAALFKAYKITIGFQKQLHSMVNCCLAQMTNNIKV